MREFGIVNKTWGREDIIISNELYCTKYLIFDNANSKTSMHFHKEKHETWKVIQGKFRVDYIETATGTVLSKILEKDAVWVNEPLMPHQLISLENNSIVLETSTADSIDDNYRVYR